MNAWTEFPIFGAVLSGAVGLVVGSFLNVVIHRLPREGMSIVRPRSMCPQCRTLIPWYDNIPVVSYALLLGRCRRCKTRISPRYPFVELLTAALFVVLFYRWVVPAYKEDHLDWQSGFAFAVYLYLLSVLVAASFIDIDFRILPDELTLSGNVVAPIVSAIAPVLHRQGWLFAKLQPAVGDHLAGLGSSLAGMAVGMGIIYLVGRAGQILFRKVIAREGMDEAMGLGDLKYMGMIGGLLGAESVLLVFLLACVVGSMVGLVRMLFTKDHYIAFGPYLSLGAILVIFFRPQITHFLFRTWPELLQGR